jgi:MFS family permease
MKRITIQRLLEATAFALVTFLVASSATNLFLFLYTKYSLDKGVQPPFYAEICTENKCHCSIISKYYATFMIVPFAAAPIGGIIYDKKIRKRRGLSPVGFAIMLAAYLLLTYIAATYWCDQCDARASNKCPRGIQSYYCTIIPPTCDFTCKP